MATSSQKPRSTDLVAAVRKVAKAKSDTDTIDESEFQAHLERALNSPHRSTRVWRMNCGQIVYTRNGAKNVFRGAPAGSGDLVGYTIGRLGHGQYLGSAHLEIEVKARKGKLRKDQVARQKAAMKAGWPYVVARAGTDLKESVVAALALIDAAILSCQQIGRKSVPGEHELRDALAEARL